MTDGWECTGEVRWVESYHVDPSRRKTLQQRWRRKAHMPITRKMLGLGEYDYEWRDVPTVMEEGE